MSAVPHAAADGDLALARVNAVFELRGPGRERVAQSAADLVHALQRFAADPDCACDLDVSLDVDSAGGC